MEEIGEEEGLTIAENAFGKIAQLMLDRDVTVKEHFKKFITTEVLEMEDGQEYDIELMTPEGFMLGLQNLGITEMTDTEVQCLMLILVKPELENTIVVSDLQMVMENFGIKDPEGTSSPQPSPGQK